MTTAEAPAKPNRRDFVAPVEVRWCPGCGDYAILNVMQKVLPELSIPRENFVFVSGIGCSSRFPYYMNTYGFHAIHGRAPTVASGIKVANPDLSVWVITGDGDGLSIGGNHLMHALRRNLNINILLFNNRIYGLTKGQYSPTSEVGKVTKSSPHGSVDHPINPLRFAIAAEATFVARTLDTNPKHMAMVFEAAARHNGVSFVEIFQNCVIYNDKAFDDSTGRSVRDERVINLEQGKPLVFGKEKKFGISINGVEPKIVDVPSEDSIPDEVVVHDENAENPSYAYMLSQLNHPEYPTPIGIFRQVDNKEVYERQIEAKISDAIAKKGKGKLQDLLNGSENWEVKGEAITNASIKPVINENVAQEMRIMKEQTTEENKTDNNALYSSLTVKLDEIIDRYGTSDIMTLQAKASINEAIAIFRDHPIGSLLIMEGEELKGIVTERDILHKVLHQDMDRDKTSVDTIMTPQPETIDALFSVADALHRMSTGKFRNLPVQRKDGSLKIISVKSLLRFIYQRTQK